MDGSSNNRKFLKLHNSVDFMITNPKDVTHSVAIMMDPAVSFPKQCSQVAYDTFYEVLSKLGLLINFSDLVQKVAILSLITSLV